MGRNMRQRTKQAQGPRDKNESGVCEGSEEARAGHREEGGRGAQSEHRKAGRSRTWRTREPQRKPLRNCEAGSDTI